MSTLTQPTHFDRPAIGAQFTAPNGETVTVAATWELGVVFHGERCASAQELLTDYTPIHQGDRP